MAGPAPYTGSSRPPLTTHTTSAALIRGAVTLFRGRAPGGFVGITSLEWTSGLAGRVRGSLRCSPAGEGASPRAAVGERGACGVIGVGDPARSPSRAARGRDLGCSSSRPPSTPLPAARTSRKNTTPLARVPTTTGCSAAGSAMNAASVHSSSTVPNCPIRAPLLKFHITTPPSSPTTTRRRARASSIALATCAAVSSNAAATSNPIALLPVFTLHTDTRPL